MKEYGSSDLRNICLAGSQGDGKTSLAETLLFNAGVTSRIGRVEEGNTVCDYSEEEISRRISVNLSTAFFEQKGKKINMLVTPGYPDFIGELYAGLGVCEVAVFVMSADSLLTPVGENIWEYLEEKNIPTAVFLNKMDKENIDFNRITASLKERLGSKIVFMNVPNGTGQALSAVTDLMDERSSEKFKDLRDNMVEGISSGDDKLTEEYLGGQQISQEELRTTLKAELKARGVIPVICGSATKNIGIKEFADFIIEYFPSPEPPAGQDNSKLTAIVYKTLSEPGMGQLNLIKVLSGKLLAGIDVFNVTKQTKERIGQITDIQGKKRVDVASVLPGDLAVLVKLRDTKTNDVLASEKSVSENVRHIDFPESIFDRAIVAQSKGDEDKVGSALAVFTLEYPTIRHFFNAETKQMIVSAMGSLQLDIMAQKIKSRYGVSIVLQKPRVPYKETVHGTAEVQGKYKRQSGGRGQYGDCWLKIEPLSRGKGFEFVNKIVGGAIPRNYIPAIEKGVIEAMEQGVIAGYPVVDMRVTVFDGSYHEVDSSDMAFKIAGAMALRKAVTTSRPSLIEPIMNIEVVIPGEYMGAVMGDLNSRRGRVMGMDKSGRKELIKAQAPLAEMFEYASDLRSLTKGSGRFSMKLSHYEETPPQITQTLMDVYQKSAVSVAE
jgi:elongation factor G